MPSTQAMRRGRPDPSGRCAPRPASELGRALDVQFLLGLARYVFLSPFSLAFLADVGAVMKPSPVRFFGIEGVLAIAVVAIGRFRARKAATARRPPPFACVWRRSWRCVEAAVLEVLGSATSGNAVWCRRDRWVTQLAIDRQETRDDLRRTSSSACHVIVRGFRPP
jgi:hypothetical protein